MDGKWIVDYSTAPPPSNGKLGPFVGIARQIIDLSAGTYVNYLSVPGEVEKEWLSARLEATFVEWDGELLEDDRSSEREEEEDEIEEKSVVVPKEETFFESLTSLFRRDETAGDNGADDAVPDYGADSWKVDFKTLTIKVFGFPFLTQKFKEGTSRVWRMSYLDEDTRIVRAGRTGREKDAMLFYMSRDD